MAKLNDLTGQRFGKLTVLGRAGSNEYGAAVWRCRCDGCGRVVEVIGSVLHRGDARSCGGKDCRERRASDPEYISTLCWGCKNALGGCPWSARFEPVPGWDAVATVIEGNYIQVPSYHVRACPLFEPDG